MLLFLSIFIFLRFYFLQDLNNHDLTISLSPTNFYSHFYFRIYIFTTYIFTFDTRTSNFNFSFLNHQNIFISYLHLYSLILFIFPISISFNSLQYRFQSIPNDLHSRFIRMSGSFRIGDRYTRLN